MFDRIFVLVTASFQWVINCFTTFFENTGARFYFIAFFSIFCVVRFLIIPLMGRGMSLGSDSVKDTSNNPKATLYVHHYFHRKKNDKIRK